MAECQVSSYVPDGEAQAKKETKLTAGCSGTESRKVISVINLLVNNSTRKIQFNVPMVPITGSGASKRHQ